MSDVDFDTLGPLILGCAVLVIGSMAKVFLEYDRVRPGAPIAERGRILFRQLYLAPDFVLLSFGLLISARTLEAYLTGHRVVSNLGDRFATWFWLLILGNVGALLLCIVLWQFSNKDKYIPIQPVKRKGYGPKGDIVERSEYSPMWIAGLFSPAGWPTLVFGNFVGLLCLLSYFVFVTRAF